MTTTQKPDLISTPQSDSEAHIINAAIRCFDKLEPQRISMDDIANEARVSRNTVYRTFKDRAELIQMVLMQRLSTMFIKAERKVKAFDGVEETFVEGSLASIAIGQKDKLFIRIVQNDTDYKVEQFLFQEDDAIQEKLLGIWAPVIRRGREQGLLRSDLSDTDIVKLLRSVHFSLHNREDLSLAGRRFFVRNLFWAAITNKTL